MSKRNHGRGKGAILVTLYHNATLFNPEKKAVESIVCNRKAAKFTLGPSMICLMVCLVLTCHLIVTIANLLIFLTLRTFLPKKHNAHCSFFSPNLDFSSFCYYCSLTVSWMLYFCMVPSCKIIFTEVIWILFSPYAFWICSWMLAIN